MSRPMFMIGLIASTALHAWLIWGGGALIDEPIQTAAADSVERIVAEVAEITQRLTPPEPPAPAPAVKPAVKKPTPKPAVAEPKQAPKPPAMPLVKTHTPPSARKVGGDLAGARTGATTPAVRIDWGSTAEAEAVLAAGRMKLVRLRSDLTFAEELVRDGRQWVVRPFQADPAVRYSNNLRVVDRVGAFAEVVAAAGLTGGERLAVLIPVDVERGMAAAQSQAASRGGLAVEQVRVFGGRFAAGPSGVRFIVTKMQRRGDPS